MSSSLPVIDGPPTPTRRRNVTPYVLIAVAAVGIVVGAVLRVGADNRRTDSVTSRYGLAGTELADPWERPDFTLTTTEGESFNFANETQGRLTLLFFGYTSCPDVCPIHLAPLAGAIAQPGIPDPMVIFVGIDSERDTPDAVRNYLERFDSDFIGLVGTPTELQAAQRATGVAVGFAEPVDENGDYLVGHASQIVAYTSDDLSHIVYPFGVRRQDWMNDLPKLNSITWADER